MTAQQHIVFHPANSWGHIKALLALVPRIAERRTKSALVITILTSSVMLPKVRQDLALMPSAVSERINVVDVAGPEKTQMDPVVEFIPAFAALWQGQPIKCLSTQRIFEGLPRPSLAIVDPFCPYGIHAVRAAAGRECRILAWITAPMSSILRTFGPERLGGLGDLQGKIEAEAQKTGKPAPAVAMSVYRRCSGEVVRVPGIPEAYDYETYPQEDVLPVALFIQGIHRFLLEADGVVCVSSSAFEGDSIAASRKWLEESGKELWIVGPLEGVPPSTTAPEPRAEKPEHSEEDARVMSFFDKQVTLHGERRVLFIAFGSMFYPKDQTKLHAFVTLLLDLKVPFLWSHASPLAKVPPELAARIEASESAYHAGWVPQRAALAHPALQWFVSHGGWNSVQEALSLRVPMILWPISGDQAHNAALLDLTHRAAFELLSVREAEGAQPPLRIVRAGAPPIDFSVEGVRKEVLQLLERVRSDEGALVRANAEKLGAAMDKSWNKDGEASIQLEKFLLKYVGEA